MATVTYGDYPPFEIDDNRADLIAYYRGEGAEVTVGGPDAFDPAEHNAGDVEAYLAELDLDDEAGVAEYNRVIAAEEAGKGRKSVLALALAE